MVGRDYRSSANKTDDINLGDLPIRVTRETFGYIGVACAGVTQAVSYLTEWDIQRERKEVKVTPWQSFLFRSNQ